MNLGQVKTIALNLINAAGDTDFISKINDFINIAQMEIAALERISGTKSIIQTSIDDIGFNSYSMPSDLLEFRYITLDSIKYYDYYIENKKLYIPKNIDGTIIINYFKYPSDIDSTTNDSYEFEVSPISQTAIPYYAASLLIAEDNENLSRNLYNIYISKLKMIEREIDNTPSVISNVLGW